MIDILLATYNGERYLPELLSSLEQQTYTDWKLIVIDDCSKDKTTDILRSFQKASKHSVEISVNSKPVGCGKENFFALARKSTGDYIAFCDQDDVWLPNKLETCMQAMRNAEKESTSLPILVYSDLKVVDNDLNLISPSFFSYSNYRKNPQLQHLICQNQITGCTILANKALNQLCIQAKKYNQILMHDSWYGITAMTFGKVIYINKSLILYRQHGNNSVGAINANSIQYKLHRLLNPIKMRRSNYDHILEVNYFLITFKQSIIGNQHQALLTDFANLKDKTKSAYRKICRKYKIYKYPFYRKLGQLYFAQR